MVLDTDSRCYVPVFYVLTSPKTHAAYWNILTFIASALDGRVDARSIVCDFEKALINAVRDYFQDTPIVGCHFHWKQACQRRLKKYRMPTAEIDIAMEKGMIDVLSVI